MEAKDQSFCKNCKVFFGSDKQSEHSKHEILSQAEYKDCIETKIASLDSLRTRTILLKNMLKYIEGSMEKAEADTKQEAKEKAMEKKIEDAKVYINEYAKEKEFMQKMASENLEDLAKQVEEITEQVKVQKKALVEQESLLDSNKNPEKYVETLIHLATTKEDVKVTEAVKKGEEIGAKLMEVEEIMNDSELYPLKTVKTLIEVASKPQNYSPYKDWAAPYFKKFEMMKRNKSEDEELERKESLISTLIAAFLKEAPKEFLLVQQLLEMSKSLVISGLPVGDDAMLEIFKRVDKSDLNAEGWFIDSCNLTEGFMLGLGRVCSKKPEVVSIADNPKIGARGLETFLLLFNLMGVSIQCLDISGIPLSDAAIKALRDSRPRQRYLLMLNNCQIPPASISNLADTLKVHNGLRALFLDSNALGDESVVTIAKNLNPLRLEVLSLANNGLTDKCVTGLLEGLKVKELGEEKVNLKALVLCRNQLGDSGIELLGKGLGQFPALQALLLRDNNISDAGICKLVDALKEKENLIRGLWLNGNPITDKGCEALSECINSLVLLSLDRTKITGEGAGKLASKIKKDPEKAKKKRVIFKDGTEYRKISQHAPLSLSLESCPLGPEGALELFKAAQTEPIEVLNLSNTGLNDEGLEKIANIMKNGENAVKHLFFIHNNISPKGIKRFSEIISQGIEAENWFVRGLYLDENQIGKESFESLKTLVNKLRLETLSLAKKTKINVDATVMSAMQNYNTWFLREPKEILTFRIMSATVHDPMRKKEGLMGEVLGIKEFEKDLEKIESPCVLLY
eukprot:TRINITY_DN324_c0_g1_i1.p1 TRINITY_DN324_c0_g1~~TRINITY_DN324_c0_g1_i1.p1  ORF type:complete len:827 (-),score=123.23 TRINITY_DN324_c0_g1_i1:2846-5239(-)